MRLLRLRLRGIKDCLKLSSFKSAGARFEAVLRAKSLTTPLSVRSRKPVLLTHLQRLLSTSLNKEGAPALILAHFKRTELSGRSNSANFFALNAMSLELNRLTSALQTGPLLGEPRGERSPRSSEDNHAGLLRRQDFLSYCKLFDSRERETLQSIGIKLDSQSRFVRGNQEAVFHL